MNHGSVYASLPLDQPKKEIRLVEILKTSPQLRCRLSKASLLGHPTFCTLSYVWGASKDYQNIIVNDVSFLATKSLADALSNIQVHWAKAFPDRDKTEMRFWADALCINQTDNIEKGYQVPLMKDIYSSTQITFCSLDAISLTSNIPAAIDLIYEISIRLDQKHSDNRLEAAVGILENLPSRRFHIKIGSESWKAKNHKLEASQANIINDFSRLAYWERAWIVQELVLSKEVILYYETSAIGFESFARVAKWASKLLEKAHTSTALPFSKTTIPQAQYVIANCLNEFSTVRKVHDLRKLYHCHCPEVHDLRFLWVWGASFRATNPKDHVYALSGIANLNIQPRYDENVSVADVYIEFCVRQTKSPSYAPLHFLQYAGLSNGDLSEVGLPTWVPNFPACAETFGDRLNVCLSHPGRTAKLWKDCIGRVEDISIHDRSLRTTSLHIDCISDISPTLHPNSPLHPKEHIAFLQHLYKMLYDAFKASETPYRKNSHPFLKLASAFYHARIPGRVWNTLELIRVARMLLCLHVSVLTSGENDSYEESFGDFPKNICCDLKHYMEAGDLEDQPYFRFFVRTINDRSFEGVDWPRSSSDDLRRFARKGIRVARTMGNEFAVVPPETIVGDRIVLLTGCHDLPLIRKVEERYIYVGRVGFAEEIVERRIKEHKAGQVDLERIELR